MYYENSVIFVRIARFITVRVSMYLNPMWKIDEMINSEYRNEKGDVSTCRTLHAQFFEAQGFLFFFKVRFSRTHTRVSI